MMLKFEKNFDKRIRRESTEIGLSPQSQFIISDIRNRRVGHSIYIFSTLVQAILVTTV